jgi:hypothetical protein
MGDDLVLDGLFLEGVGDGLMQGAEMDGAPPRPAEGYVTVPLAWLARVRREARSVDQMLVMQVLYRQCLLRRSKTVSLPNTELRSLGISRYTKYRALAEFEDAGALTREPWNGQAARVTLHWFP